MLPLLLLALASARANPSWTDPTALVPLPGPDVAPPVHLRDIDAQFLAWTGFGQDLLGRDAGGFAVRDVSGAKRVEKPCPAWKPGLSVVDAAASPDRSTQAVLLDDGHVCVWAGGLPPLPLGRRDWHDIELVDAATLAVGRTDGTVEVRELPTGRVRWRRNVGIGPVNALRVGADGTMLYASGGKRGGAVFHIPSGRLVHTVGKEPAYAIVSDPTTNSILLGRGDGRVERWDVRTWRRTGGFDLGDGAVVDLDLSVDGKLVLAALDGPGGRSFDAWSTEVDEVVFHQPSADGAGRLVFRFVPGSLAAIGTGGGERSTMWRRPQPPPIPYPGRNIDPPRWRELPPDLVPGPLVPYPGDALGVRGGVLNPDGSRLLGVDAGGAWVVVGNGVPPVVVGGAAGLEGPPVWAPDGSRFAGWVREGELRIWGADGVLLRRFPMERPRAIAADGSRLLVAAADGTVRVSAEKGMRVVKGLADVTAVAFDPARVERFAYGTGTGDVRVLKFSGEETTRAVSVFTNPVAALAFAPDGKRLAAAAARVGGEGATVVVLAEQGVESVTVEAGTDDTSRVAMRVDELPRRLVFVGRDRLLVEEPHTARVLDLPRAGEVLAARGDVNSAAVSGLGVIVADGEGRVRRVPIGTTLLATLPHGHAIATSGDSRYTAVVDGDTLIVWDAVRAARKVELPPTGVVIVGAAFDRSARHLAALTADGGVEVYDVELGELAGHTPGPARGSWLRFSPEGGWIWTTADDGGVIAYAVADGAEKARVPFPSGATIDAARSVGRFLTTAGPAGQRVWVDSAEESKRRLWTEADGERPLGVGPAGKIVAVATAEGVERRDLSTGLKVGRTFSWEGAPAGDAGGFTPDGTFLAVADAEGVIRILDPVSGRLHRALGGDAPPTGSTVVEPPVTLTFNPTGSLLVSFDASARRRLWEWGTGHDRGYDLAVPGDVHVVAGPTRPVLSPDGATLWIGYADGTLRGWSTRTGELSQLFRGHVAPATTLALSPDGARLVSGGEDGIVRVFDLAEQTELGAFTTLGDPVAAVALDGEVVWAITRAGVVRAWDVHTHKRVGRWTGSWTEPDPPAPALSGVEAAVFGPVLTATGAGDRLFTTHADGRLRVWDLASRSFVAEITPLSDGAWVLDRADGRRISAPSLRDGTAAPLFSGPWEGVAP